MNRTLLAVDAGNTNTVFGFFRGSKLLRTWRVVSDRVSLRRISPKLPKCDRVILSSVVPHLKPDLIAVSKRVSSTAPLFVTPKLKMPVTVRIKKAKQVGQDRIVNVAAAYALYGKSPTAPFFKGGFIIVDLGTATTCDVVTPRGEYIGGTISPGIGIANRALHEKTALLPLVPIARPRRAVGRDTVEAIRSGVFYGYVGLIEGLVRRLKKELRFPVKVIATGGLSLLIGKTSGTIDTVDAHLTLKGLRLLADWNLPA